MSFILSLQQLLNPLGGNLTCDGISGTQTHNAITCAAALVRPGVYGGARELIGGRASTFGGPDDIPRAKVQAAVLEMRGQPPFGCDTWQVAEDILIKHTGITPTESTGTSVDRVLTEIEIDQYLTTGVAPTEEK